MYQLGIMQHKRLDYVWISTCLTVRGTVSLVENSSINRAPSLCTCYSGPQQPSSPQQQIFLTGPCRGGDMSVTRWSHFNPSFYSFQWEGWSVFRDLSTEHVRILMNTLSCPVNRISKALRSTSFRVWAVEQITYQWRVQLPHKDFLSNYKKKQPKRLTPEPKLQSPLECAGRMWGYSGSPQRDLCLASESRILPGLSGTAVVWRRLSV